MPLLTLTTDYGLRDPYVAMLRGRLLSRFPHWRTEDISHNISKYDLVEAVYVLKTAFPFFPPGTVHLLDVGYRSKNQENPWPSFIVVRYQGHWFALPDQGLLPLLVDRDEPPLVQRYPLTVSRPNAGFALLDWLDGPLGMLIQALGQDPSRTKAPEPWQEPVSDTTGMWLDKVYERDGVLHGRVLYADSYGNLHTNLDQATVEAFVSDRPFEVLLRSRQPHENRSDRIQGYYHAVEGQRLTLLYNAIGYLEIALNTNHAESLLGLRVQDQVMIERS